MTKKEEDKGSLKESLSRLSKIVEWFNSQEEVDVEKGMEKVKEAVGLIKASKARLKEISNEFEEIRKEVDEEIEELEDEEDEGEEKIDPEEIEF